MEPDATKLEFVLVKIKDIVRLIPKELIEAVKGRLFTPEQFYDYQERQIEYQNPYNLLFALVRENNKIEGYLWAEICQIDGTLFVNTFSISKEHWYRGKAMPMLISFLDKIKSKHKCPRCFWVTTNPKFFEKHKFTRSKNVLMEYNSN